MVYKQPKSKYWWFKFTWNGELVRKSTKQTNKRVAEQMEAAHRTALAKGEVGINQKKPIPTLRQFAEQDILPFIRSTFAAKPKTQSYYENGIKNLLKFESLAEQRLDAVSSDIVAGFIRHRQQAVGKGGKSLQTASLNRELQVLRRLLHLAEEWGTVTKPLPKVKMLPGEKHRERVLSAEEESLYLSATSSAAMSRYRDPYLLRDVAFILLDCGLRPEECFRLRVENVSGSKIEVHFGKTKNARRRIPMTPRVRAVIDMRLAQLGSDGWLFRAETRSGHIEPSTIRKQHATAIREANAALKDGEMAGSTFIRFGTLA